VTEEAPSAVRLLLADDDVRLVHYLRILLQRTRTTFHIDSVDNGVDALRVLAQGLHHVCLLDYRLGTDDGLHILRQAHARKLRTPVILLTGDEDESLEFTALEEGAADYLNKADLDPSRLERVICRAIARHRADAALREWEKRLAEAEAFALVMSAEVGLDGRWLKVSRRLCDLLGYTEEELFQKGLTDVVHPDDLSVGEEERRRLMEGGVRSVEIERRYVRKDGGIVWMYQNCSLVSGEDGVPHYVLMYLRDVGEQRRAEEALRASEQRYRSMVCRAPYGIFEAGTDGRFLAVNPALARMLGVESEQAALQVDPDELYGGAEERRRVFEQLSAPGPSTAGASWTRPDGSSCLVQISADVSPEGLVLTGVVEDVTERSRLEEQLRQAHKMEAVGQLAGGVAHDFNNLLTAILGYAELLKDNCRDMPEVYANLDEIHKAGKTAAALTEQLLVLSRKRMVRPEVLYVNSVIDGIRNLLTRVLGEDVTLVTTLGSDVPRIEADAVQLQQLILNLAVNARDAMPRGGRLTIETAGMGPGVPRPLATALPGGYAAITVRDDGCGMDPATQMRIFEPFVTTKPPGKGTGLGLSAVYGIVKQSGGEIVCESSPGAGTTFTLELERAEALAHAA